jgi:peptide/nickel transport system substrate-binding protein
MAAKPAGEDASEGDIANLVGSGPYKIEEWVVGDHVTLTRNEEYIPRSEPGSYTAGGKRAYIDKLTWIEIPAEETKIAGLKTSEWDVVDGAGLDHFFPLSEDPNINISTYPFHKSFLGISHKEPPTDSVKVRQAILLALDWEQLMSGIGPKELWFLCPAIYYCNTPLETDIGADEWYSQNDIPRAKKLLEEAGYAGETLFIMNPADYATIAPLGPVLKQQLEDIGMTTEMPGMDWSTLISRIYDLGWNVFTSWSTHNGFGSPIHDLNNVDGGTGYGGGFTFPDQIEARKEFAFAATHAEQLAAVEKLQMAYFINVPRIYGGQWSSIYPYRTYIKNFTTPSYPMYMHAWIEK